MRALFIRPVFSLDVRPHVPCRFIDILVHPAATAANIAAPKAQVCSEADHTDGMSSTSASVCITKGAFLLIPPMALTESMRSPGPSYAPQYGGNRRRWLPPAHGIFRGAGTQRESRNGTLHVLVRIRGTAAVHPVQGDNTVLGGFHVLGLTG